MELLIITGLSGAGKSRAADVLEDMDYYCVDNMPAALLPKFAELCLATRGRYEKVALVTDARERESVEALLAALDGLWASGMEYRVLYMEAERQAIIKRYKESRRPHPLLEKAGTIDAAIAMEERMLAPMRERADFVIDSSRLTNSMLQSRILSLLDPGGEKKPMSVTVTAFGYKYGVPIDADMMFDVRFLPNPFYIEELRPLSGMDRRVFDFVFGYEDTRTFMGHIEKLLDFSIPLYMEEGRYTLNIAVGCTGGRHRSVAVAKAVADYLESRGMNVVRNNRDVDKG